MTIPGPLFTIGGFLVAARFLSQLMKAAGLFLVMAMFGLMTVQAEAAKRGPSSSEPGPLNGNVTFFFAPDQNAHQGVIEAINSATTKINMVMYHMSDTNVAAALAEAAKRGVNVRVLFDAGQWKSSSAIVTTLQSAGVQVRQASSFFSITHEKAMTLDDNVGMISTMNQVATYMDMLDFGVFFEDQSVITEFNSVFETDWDNVAGNTGNTPALSNPNLVWSPINSQDKLVALIASAQTSLNLTVENLGNTAILDALGAAAKRGVAVRTLVPECEIGTPGYNQPFSETLIKSGVEAHMVPGPATSQLPYIHAKSIVVDGSEVYLGSENFSNNSLLKAREVGLIMDNADVSADITSLFEQIWTNSVVPPSTATYNCAAFPAIAGSNAMFRMPEMLDLSHKHRSAKTSLR